MYYIDQVLKILTAISDVFTIIAAGIAIYVFFTKRKAISSVFHVLINFSSQITLQELKTKLEKLNDLSAEDPQHAKEIINILNEIAGQINGHKRLCKHCESVVSKIISLSDKRNRGITEAKKRGIVSELRERLRNFDVESYADLIGD